MSLLLISGCLKNNNINFFQQLITINRYFNNNDGMVNDVKDNIYDDIYVEICF